MGDRLVAKKIGGFFPLQLPTSQCNNNLLSLWAPPDFQAYFFSNARSALAYLLQKKKIGRIWLPAYGCVALKEAAKAAAVDICLYPLGKSLSPDCVFLKQFITAGDAVLAIDYFGRNPSQEFCELAASSRDILWIEDRAQAFYPSKTPWGDAVLYSPRKLLGVADGGILTGKTLHLSSPQYVFNPDENKISAAQLRYEDKEEYRNDIWYAAYVEQENSQSANLYNINKTSLEILAGTDSIPIFEQRRINEAVLRRYLADIVLLPRDDEFIPFGFPIRVSNRAKVAHFLQQHNVFAAHHWPSICGSKDDFPFEHELVENMLTLPLDHRYDASDMENVAALVKQATE